MAMDVERVLGRVAWRCRWGGWFGCVTRDAVLEV